MHKISPFLYNLYTANSIKSFQKRKLRTIYERARDDGLLVI